MSDEQRYRAMFEQSPQPMWMFDRETLRILSVNEAAIRHYGYTREEFLAMTIADIRPPEDVSAMQADVDLAFGLASPRRWRHVKKDGQIIIVEIAANDFSLDGRGVRLVLVKDITERITAQEALRRTEDQLRHAQKMDALGQLAGGIAHDFNNLLTVITACAEMLEDSIAPDDPRRVDALEIRRASEGGTAITRQLLALSRHSIVAPKPLMLDRVVTDFTRMLRRFVGERVSLVTQLSPVPAVLADQGQIEQVLMNLAVNARDAMPTGGRLSIETSVVELDGETAAMRRLAAGRYVTLSITDTGIGMSVDVQQRMFDPFFTTKEAGKGTGLGLSIVHGIVSQAGGTISAYSELGHGTTFRIHLPVCEKTETATPVAKPVVPRTLPKLTVLVVDDDQSVRSVTARILQEAGCDTLEAATADEARRIVVSHDGTIDVVLLDVVLRDGRGDQLIEQLRALRPAMVAVLMSGYPAGALGPAGEIAYALLAKPFTAAELRGAIARAAGVTEPASPDRATKAVSPRYRVLVADDDDELRRALGRVLRRAQFEVVEVETGRKAIEALERQKIDVIVSDVHMPEGGGIDLMRSVRRSDLDVPIILMSGEPDVATAASAIEWGAFRYLTKPIDFDTFTTCVRHAARAHALARIRREASSISGARAGAADRIGLEVRLERALDQLWLAYQPIVRANGAPFGVEALLRSGEPTMPGPQAVLDAATQLDRLPLVGRRVRGVAAAALAARTDLQLFVNLHPADLADIELVAEDSPLSEIAPRVILEITERASLDISGDLPERLARLRALGFRIAVDDIGAGYSGLTSFTELMPEIVKIDMSLVRNVHLSAVKQRTIGALCSLCREVNCLVVGEGVETIEERDCLVSLGCDLLQGYLIARPARELPAAE